MNCTICGKPIILRPSAAERARKYGGKPEDYTRLFTTHAECAVGRNKQDALKLIAERYPVKL